MSTFVLKDYVATTCSALGPNLVQHFWWLPILFCALFFGKITKLICFWHSFECNLDHEEPWCVACMAVHGFATVNLLKLQEKSSARGGRAQPYRVIPWNFYWLVSQTEPNYIWNFGIWTTTMTMKWNLAQKKSVCLQCFKLGWSGKCFHIPTENGIWE